MSSPLICKTPLHTRSATELPPGIHRASGAQPEDKAVKIPELNVDAWRSAPVQDHGRYKPFETAAREVLRNIHGRIRNPSYDGIQVYAGLMFTF